MDVRRRNRLIVAFYTVLACVPLAVIFWVLWQVAGRTPHRTAAGLAMLAAGVILPLVWSEVRFRRSLREADDALRQAGIDPDKIAEEPLPLFPRMRLAKDRDQLAAGVLFTALLVFVFVAYYAGWI